MMENSGGGFIYVLANPAMPKLVKIGIATDVGRRATVLRTTGVPTPFVVAYQLEIACRRFLEGCLHHALSSARVAADREFFEMSIDEAVDAIGVTIEAMIEYASANPSQFTRDGLMGIARMSNQYGQDCIRRGNALLRLADASEA